ncbi:MAG: tRNA (N6-isopentenyl adenosine(37)-C2)-methylthiotransferase MiaB [Chloroflexi bacterium]|nr:tRNA (N6-isopentenyl adenosine(37)-C2)-methylthiotransferase MiaB [Chloroflexota bacterium]
MQTYHVWTIGCQMNRADSDRLEGALVQLGLKPTPSPRDADVVVLNSCVVRQSAEDRVVGMLTSLKPIKSRHPQRIVALMGCMVGPKADGLRDRFPYVDVFLRPQDYHPLLDLLGDRLGFDAEGCLETLTPPRASVAELVPVIHGCDRFCTFCIIPYRRGRQRSRPISEVVREVELLAARGVREVTLLGQTVDAYGHDLPDRPDLAHLLGAVHQVEGLERIRFLTSHPSEMTQRIIDAVASLDKVCEHCNLPFQAGDDDVLRAMRRDYTADDYRRLVERIRARVPEASIATDVIVGFPGESDIAFHRTLQMLEEVRFDKVHVAAYSERPGTIAARKLPDDVPNQEKRRRLDEVEALQERLLTEANARLLGTAQEVLVQGRKKGKWWGRTRGDKLVFLEDPRSLLGKTVRVQVQKTSAWSLQGEAVA